MAESRELMRYFTFVFDLFLGSQGCSYFPKTRALQPLDLLSLFIRNTAYSRHLAMSLYETNGTESVPV